MLLNHEVRLKQADFASVRKQIYRQRSKLSEKEKVLLHTKRQLRQAVDVVTKSFHTGMTLRKDLATAQRHLQGERAISAELRDGVARTEEQSKDLSTKLHGATSTIQNMQGAAATTATETERMKLLLETANSEIDGLRSNIAASHEKCVKVEAKLLKANTTIATHNEQISRAEQTARDALSQRVALQKSLVTCQEGLEIAEKTTQEYLSQLESVEAEARSQTSESEDARYALLRFVCIVLGIDESFVAPEAQGNQHALLETMQAQIVQFSSAWQIETESVNDIVQCLSESDEIITALRTKLDRVSLKYRLDMQDWSKKMEIRSREHKVQFDAAMAAAMDAKNRYVTDVGLLETHIRTLVKELSSIRKDYRMIQDYIGDLGSSNVR
ncbi:hypothetical protein N0V95_006015 [Ascochyta clinopodiicola]|nr:hypothetical protein N0V95_006015 [Ascochyta clinopodiicola]